MDRSLVAVEVVVGVTVVAAIVGKAYGAAPTIIFLLAGVSLAFSVYVGVRMFTALGDRSLDVTGRVADVKRAALEHEKLLLLYGMHELEADAAIGKVDAADYQQLRARSEMDALTIIETLKAQDDKWMAEARRLVTKRLGPAAAKGPGPKVKPNANAVAVPQIQRVEPVGPVAYEPLFDERPVALTLKDDTLTCTDCKTESPADAGFCIGCGRPREGVAA